GEGALAGARLEIHFDDCVEAGGSDEEGLAVFGEAHSAGDGVSRIAGGGERDFFFEGAVEVFVEHLLQIALVGVDDGSQAVGSTVQAGRSGGPDDAVKAGTDVVAFGVRAEGGAGAGQHTTWRAEEDFVLGEYGELVFGGVERDVAWAAGEGNAIGLEALSAA